MARTKAEALSAIARMRECEACGRAGAQALLSLASNFSLGDLEAAECAHAMLLRGAKIDSRAEEGATVLARALSLGRHALSIELLDLGASAAKPDREGRDPMHHLILGLRRGAARPRDGHSGPGSPSALDCAAMLLAAGCEPSRRARDGRYALHEAAAQDLPELCSLLLAAGSECQARDSFGYGPLAEALRHGSLRAARPIIERLNDLGRQGPIDEPAIHAAADFGSIPFAKTLASLGADMLAVDSKGMDAAARAASHPHCQPGVASFFAAAKDLAALRLSSPEAASASASPSKPLRV